MRHKQEIVDTMGVLVREMIRHDSEKGKLTVSGYVLHCIEVIEDLEAEFNLTHKESVACHEYLNYKLKGSN